MKLYRSLRHPRHWIAFVPKEGYVAFPAERAGWMRRHPARGLDPMDLREVPLRLAFNTGLLEVDSSSQRSVRGAAV